MGVLENQLAEATKQCNLYQAACQVFALSGVRAYILDMVTPYLNSRTSYYLDILSDGAMRAEWVTLSKNAKGELKDKFSIAIEARQGAKSFEALSGGEKRKVRLACAFAIQDLVAQRVADPIRLFVADEIDDALDAAGLERLMTVLEEKAAQGNCVMVISHNDLQHWIPNVLTVVKEGGVSYID